LVLRGEIEAALDQHRAAVAHIPLKHGSRRFEPVELGGHIGSEVRPEVGSEIARQYCGHDRRQRQADDQARILNLRAAAGNGVRMKFPNGE
jgi:hypothetical protein